MTKPPSIIRNELPKEVGDRVSIVDLTNICSGNLIGEIIEHEENPNISVVIWNDGKTTHHYDKDLFLVGD